MNPRVDLDELVTGAEIARRLQPPVSRQRVQQLTQTDGFPAPLGKIGNYVLFRWRDVERWARANGRLERELQAGEKT